MLQVSTILAVLYETTGAYDKAEPLYLESMAVRSEVLDKKHEQYVSSLNLLAALYTATGACNKAQPLYLESVAIRSEVLGKKHVEYAANLNDFGSTVQDRFIRQS